MRILAAVVGPVACWIPLLLYYFVPEISSGLWIDSLPLHLQDLAESITKITYITYFPLSSAICGFSASYFLREECANLPKGTKITIGFWTHFLFILPLLLNILTLCCLFGVVAPIHMWIFDQAFFRGVKFWRSEWPKQSLGEYEKPPEIDEPRV